MNIGEMGVPFIYQGEELIYPEYVKDGLVLHYDFSGMTNEDVTKDIATDLSGNGNHGTLQNFNYTAESGYDKNKLLFDGVDDRVINENHIDVSGGLTFETVAKYYELTTNNQNIAVIFRGGSSSVQGMRVAWNYSKYYYPWYSDITGTTTNYIEPSTTAKADEFQHVVVTVSPVGDFKGYINGVEHPVREPKIDIMGSMIELGIPRIDLGTTRHESGSTKLYNRPLTPEEIAHNYAIEKERFGIE